MGRPVRSTLPPGKSPQRPLLGNVERTASHLHGVSFCVR
jgi:hypothetical protein